MAQFAGASDRAALEAGLPYEAHAPATTLYRFLTRARDNWGARNAITFQILSDPKSRAETLSWSDLHAKVTQTANLLRGLGVGEGDVVAYLLPNCNETVLALLGGAVAGIVNPINPMLEPEKIASILRETGAKVLVTLKAFPKSDLAQKAADAVALAPSVKVVLEVDLNRYLSPPKSWIVPFLRPKTTASHQARVMDFNRAIAAQPSVLTFADSVGDRVAAYFHTGGTTGMPKVAQHTYAGMIYNGWIGASIIFQPEHVLICPLPLFHVLAAYPVLMSCIASGAHMVMPTPQGYRGEGVFDNFWKLIERYRVTFLITVPTAVAALMQRPVNADISSLQSAISGSAALPVEIFNRFKAATGVEIAEGYGLTEASCLVSCNPIVGHKKVGSVGIPLPYSNVRILHMTAAGMVLRDCGVDEVGEICVFNPGVLPGRTYTEADKNIGLYAARDWLRTGDLGRIDGDGYLWITGRAKDLIIRGGHNIDPSTIEEALQGHPAVAMAGAIGQPDGFAGELPCVYVELVKGANVSVGELMQWASDHISERAALPKHIEIVGELPKTAVGKIFKPDLRRMAIRRVFDEAFAGARIAARVGDVVEDKKRGLVARFIKTGPVDEAAVAALMGQFTTPWEWQG